MYDFIRGKCVEATSEYMVLDVGGVGYKLLTPLSAYGKITGIEEVFLFCSFIVRELSQTLYGFLTREERDLFEMLITVSGIGPKTALSIVGHLSVGQFYQAIHANNLLALSKIPGIGKKTAERLVVELKGKKLAVPTDLSSFSTSVPIPHLQDALNALLHLGFSHAVAEQALKKAIGELPENTDLSTLIATALRCKSTH